MTTPDKSNRRQERSNHSNRHRSTPASTFTATVKAACRLDAGTLLIVGAIDRLSGQSYEAAARTTAGSQPMTIHVVSGDAGRSAQTAVDEVRRWCWIGILKVSQEEVSGERLIIEAVSSNLFVEPADLPDIRSELGSVLSTYLAPLDLHARARVMAVLVTALGSERNPASDPLRISQALHAAREALRERLSHSATVPTASQAVHVESIYAIDERAFYMRGWIRDRDVAQSRLTAVTPEGVRVELTGRVFQYARPDIEAFFGASIARGAASSREGMAGFIVFLETDAPSYLLDGWIVELLDAMDNGVETKAPTVLHEEDTIRSGILASMIDPNLESELLRVEHLHPALDRLQQRRRAEVRVDRVQQYGSPPPSPEVSIVVPLYQRIDFLEHQLAQFVHDPELTRTDLIYVLDSPELATPLCESAALLHQLYRIPFRVVILSENIGFSGANNLGASVARGRLLILLNSDILPDKPGWVGAMAEFHDATPDIGAVSPKLLYEDDSIQHAGMYFYRDPRSDVWQNEHFFKGFHRNFPPANVRRPVPALTGACMMINRQLYLDLNGLRGIYVQGDYEDSDLCLRLHEAGRQTWYLPTVELYHLEGQSYPSTLRSQTGEYNRWLHSRLWSDRIEQVLAAETAVIMDRSRHGTR